MRTVLESSVAIRDNSGNVTAYQGFVLDISERKRAEHEIRRRNRELMVLNSIAQTLTESMDLDRFTSKDINSAVRVVRPGYIFPIPFR